MDSEKILSIDQLVGRTLIAYTKAEDDKSIDLVTDSGTYMLSIMDEGPLNDSNAYIKRIRIAGLFQDKIIRAFERNSSSYGVDLVLETENLVGVIQIKHDHNGYYGFNYELKLK